MAVVWFSLCFIQFAIILLQQTMSKSSVMDLEIADFEKTVSTLEGQVKVKDEVIENLEQELEHERQKHSSLEQELGVLPS